VQRLRINPALSGAGFDAAMSGGGGGMGMSGGYSERGGGEGGRGYGGEFGRGGGPSFSSAPMMTGATPGVGSEFAEVDIQGLVYIFNQPDDTALTVPGEEPAAAADETVAASGDGTVR
jgi:hypothetical protein